METLIIHPKNKKQEAALAAICEAMQIDFEVFDTNDETADIMKNEYLYSKLIQGKADMKAGKGVAIPTEDLWK